MSTNVFEGFENWSNEFKEKHARFIELNRHETAFAQQVAVRMVQIKNINLSLQHVSGSTDMGLMSERAANTERIWQELEDMKVEMDKKWQWFFEGKSISEELKKKVLSQKKMEKVRAGRKKKSKDADDDTAVPVVKPHGGGIKI